LEVLPEGDVLQVEQVENISLQPNCHNSFMLSKNDTYIAPRKEILKESGVSLQSTSQAVCSSPVHNLGFEAERLPEMPFSFFSKMYLQELRSEALDARVGTFLSMCLRFPGEVPGAYRISGTRDGARSVHDESAESIGSEKMP
jgi:hypothetical protein